MIDRHLVVVAINLQYKFKKLPKESKNKSVKIFINYLINRLLKKFRKIRKQQKTPFLRDS